MSPATRAAGSEACGQDRDGAGPPARAPEQPGQARGALPTRSDPASLYGCRESVVSVLPPIGVTQTAGGGGLISPGALVGIQVKTSYNKV